jgi:CRP-like cAMP-binding protein
MEADTSLQKLFEILAAYGQWAERQIVERLRDCLLSATATSPYFRRHLLLAEGQIADYIYFVEKGLARAFYNDHQSGREVTCFLWQAGSVATEPNSLYHRLPSRLSIEVMPDTQLLCLPYHQLADCAKDYPLAETLSRNLALWYCTQHFQRNRELSTLSAWERYAGMLKTYPDIEQVLSKEVMASYLNITPQSLSRLLRHNRHP